MNKELFTKSLAIWVLFIPIAILNGAVRNFLYKPFTGELLAHQLSSFAASIFFILLAYFLLRQKVKDLSRNMLFNIGFLWVLLTVLFEFGFGHFIMGNSWGHLLADYNLLNGRIWLLFLLTEFLSPFIIKRIVVRK